MKQRIYISILFLFLTSLVVAQRKADSAIARQNVEISRLIDFCLDMADSIHKIKVIVGQLNNDLTFSGKQIVNRDNISGTAGQLIISGYVSSYFSYYSDSSGLEQYGKFATTAPLNKAFGLNIAQLGARFVSEKSRAVFTLHYGDIPKSAWSTEYPMIQEANAGICLLPRLWLDAGLFRTHIGLESIQPRENITSSISVVDFYDPYYLAGAKLTYEVHSKIDLQINAFNSYNTFVPVNDKKAIGISAIYEPNDKWSFVFNSLRSDHTPPDGIVSHVRFYNNLYFSYRGKRLAVGGDFNAAEQEHSMLSNPLKKANMYSGLLVYKYKLAERFSIYGRIEYFKDPDEMLTGIIYNAFQRPVGGLELKGYTGGLEWKPGKTSYLRIEYRYLETRKGQEIFMLDHHASRIRYEVISSLGVWF